MGVRRPCPSYYAPGGPFSFRAARAPTAWTKDLPAADNPQARTSGGIEVPGDAYRVLQEHMVCCSGPYFYEREERNRGGAPPGLWPHEVGKLKRQVGGRSRICVTTSLAYGLRAGVWHSLRSEEHTSELQSPCNLVCRLLLETTYM